MSVSQRLAFQKPLFCLNYVYSIVVNSIEFDVHFAFEQNFHLHVIFPRMHVSKSSINRHFVVNKWTATSNTVLATANIHRFIIRLNRRLPKKIRYWFFFSPSSYCSLLWIAKHYRQHFRSGFILLIISTKWITNIEDQMECPRFDNGPTDTFINFQSNKIENRMESIVLLIFGIDDDNDPGVRIDWIQFNWHVRK